MGRENAFEVAVKIILEHEGQKATVEDETVHDITEALDLLELALIKVGFERRRG